MDMRGKHVPTSPDFASLPCHNERPEHHQKNTSMYLFLFAHGPQVDVQSHFRKEHPRIIAMIILFLFVSSDSRALILHHSLASKGFNPGSLFVLFAIRVASWSSEIDTIPGLLIIHSFSETETVSSNLHLHILCPYHVSFPNYHARCCTPQKITISQWLSERRQPRFLCFMVSLRVLHKQMQRY